MVAVEKAFCFWGWTQLPTHDALKEFLEFVVAQLVDVPEGTSLREEADERAVKYTLELPRSEMGKVIGKQGHTIQAIRSVLEASLLRHSRTVLLDVAESPEQPGNSWSGGAD